MTEIYLIRHGQTKWNTSKRFQGHTDTQLDCKGEEQAEKLSERLKAIRFDAIYSSDLSRAVHTANMVAKARPLEVQIIHQIKEIGFGHWEGCKFQEIVCKEDGVGAIWHQDPKLVEIPGGETFDQVRTRLKDALTMIIQNHPDQRVALFSHGGPIRHMLMQCFDLPSHLFWKMEVENTSISIIRWENNNFHLGCINDCAHL